VSSFSGRPTPRRCELQHHGWVAATGAPHDHRIEGKRTLAFPTPTEATKEITMASDTPFAARIPEHARRGMRLGRHVLHDERSRQYPAQRKAITSVRHNAQGLPLNQGEIGSCTAEALCGALDSAPNINGTALTQQDALNLYEAETRLEGKPYPPEDPGGTGLMVCKAAQQMRLISSYQHAFGIQQALEALVVRPVITGVSWYSSFDSPGADGLVEIAPGANVRGGHEVVADEIDAPGRLVWFWNSWGPEWGVGGRFCMSFDTWDQLLKQQGDVTVPIR
jgi:hypothetical protein